MPYKDPDKNKACKDAWRKSEIGRAYFRVRYLANAEKFKSVARARRKEDPDKTKAAFRDWRLKNPERYKAAARAWARRHPEVSSATYHRRRARLLGGGGKGISPSEWAARKEEFGGACAYCLKPCAKPHRDHMKPLAGGGDDSLENLIPSCPRCNHVKGCKNLLQFLSVGHS